MSCSPRRPHRRTPRRAYAEFLRTFEFGPNLPIVQPGENVPLGFATVRPRNIAYDEKQVGLVVPRGTYQVSFIMNPSLDAEVHLLVNNQLPESVRPPHFKYTRSLKLDPVHPIDVTHLVHADQPTNLIS